MLTINTSSRHLLIILTTFQSVWLQISVRDRRGLKSIFRVLSVPGLCGVLKKCLFPRLTQQYQRWKHEPVRVRKRKINSLGVERTGASSHVYERLFEQEILSNVVRGDTACVRPAMWSQSQHSSRFFSQTRLYAVF